MKVIHKPEIDFLSIDFKDGIEAKSVYQDGIVVRFDKGGHVLGIDITDSTHFFAKQLLTLREACDLLGISESTMRRRIREGKVKYQKLGGKDYRFSKSDLLKLA